MQSRKQVLERSDASNAKPDFQKVQMIYNIYMSAKAKLKLWLVACVC